MATAMIFTKKISYIFQQQIEQHHKRITRKLSGQYLIKAKDKFDALIKSKEAEYSVREPPKPAA